jgi:hypothetical protein
MEGAYRLLSNPRVSAEALQQPHKACTIERAEETSSVGVAHDASDVQTPWADSSKVGYLTRVRRLPKLRQRGEPLWLQFADGVDRADVSWCNHESDPKHQGV